MYIIVLHEVTGNGQQSVTVAQRSLVVTAGERYKYPSFDVGTRPLPHFQTRAPPVAESTGDPSLDRGGPQGKQLPDERKPGRLVCEEIFVLCARKGGLKRVKDTGPAEEERHIDEEDWIEVTDHNMGHRKRSQSKASKSTASGHPSAQAKSSSKVTETGEQKDSHQNTENGNVTSIGFSSGNPRIEIAKGILHFFKAVGAPTIPRGNNSATALMDGFGNDSTNAVDGTITPSTTPLPPVSTAEQAVVVPDKDDERRDLPRRRSRLVCITAVPLYMGHAELLRFLGPSEQDLSSVRLVRDEHPNRYIALLHFRSQKAADRFYLHCNGRPFNSLEAELCYLAFVERVEVIRAPSIYPFTVTASESMVTSTAKQITDGGGPKPESVQTQQLKELPTCPVCLERLDDQTSGVMTILCNHTYHCRCLSRWNDNSCPVCRHAQRPVEENSCGVCGKQESLWICLICGNIGCGRYSSGHAYQHFVDSAHNFSMEIETNRVWDYVGDAYVHRLIQNKADGKLVELPNPGAHLSQRRGGGVIGGRRRRLTPQRQTAQGSSGPVNDDKRIRRAIPDPNTAGPSTTEPLLAASSSAEGWGAVSNTTRSEAGDDDEDLPLSHHRVASAHGQQSGSNNVRSPLDDDDEDLLDECDDYDDYDEGEVDVKIEQEEKIEGIELEYTYLLTSQLEAQRRFFQERIDGMERMLVEDRQKFHADYQGVYDEKQEFKTRVANLQKEKRALERKLTQLNARCATLQEEYKQEQSISEAMSQTVEEWKVKYDTDMGAMEANIKSMTEEMADLRDQVKDLMLHFSVGNNADVAGGSVVGIGERKEN
eukprot:Clim_evm19s214 gene=Clim_evmTU19s214